MRWELEPRSRGVSSAYAVTGGFRYNTSTTYVANIMSCRYFHETLRRWRAEVVKDRDQR
jgi:hypothetical protein